MTATAEESTRALPPRRQPQPLAPGGRLRRARERLLSFLFGDDIFISYARLDATVYAAALAQQLTKREFACYLDQWTTQPGTRLPGELKAAIRRSGVFVLLLTPGACQSLAVEQEVDEFLATRRPFILIDLDPLGTVAAWGSKVAGAAKTIDARGHELTEPAPAVVDRIVNSFRVRTRNQRMRRVFFAMLAATIVVPAIGGLIAWSITSQAAAKVAESIGLRDRALAGSLNAEARQKPQYWQQLYAESLARADTSDAKSAMTMLAPSLRHSIRLVHESNVNGVAFSPDGQFVASTSDDHTVRLWRTDTGELLWKQAHDDDVYGVAFSPDGRLVATASDDETVRVWRADTGAAVTQLPHGFDVRMVAFSNDGRVATAGDDHAARIWSSDSPFLQLVLPHESSVTSVAFSVTNRVLTVAGDAAYIWDGKGTVPSQTLRHDSEVRAAVFSRTGQLVATASDDRTAGIWDVETGRQLASLPHDGEVKAVAFAPSGGLVLTGSSDQTARIWEVGSPKPRTVLQHDRPVTGVFFSNDSRLAATVAADNIVRIWNVASGALEVQLQHDNNDVKATAFSSNGRWFATASYDHSVRLWDLESGGPVAPLQHESDVNAIGVSPDERLVVTATGGFDDSGHLWDAGSGKQLAPLPHKDSVSSVDFSPAGDRVATGSFDRTAAIWNLQGRKMIRLDHPGPVTEVAFSPEGRRLGTACDDNVVRVWDLQSQKTVAQFPHPAKVTSLAFVSNGTMVRTLTNDHTARTWMIATEKQAATFPSAVSANGEFVAVIDKDFRQVSIVNASTSVEVHRLRLDLPQVNPLSISTDGRILGWGNGFAVLDAAPGKEVVHLDHSGGYSSLLSRDGQLIATMGLKGDVRVWDLHTGSAIARMDRLTGTVKGALSPSGRTYFLINEKTVYRFMLRRDDLLTYACQYLPFNLPSEAWSRYLPDEPFRSTCPLLPPVPVR